MCDSFEGFSALLATPCVVHLQSSRANVLRVRTLQVVSSWPQRWSQTSTAAGVSSRLDWKVNKATRRSVRGFSLVLVCLVYNVPKNYSTGLRSSTMAWRSCQHKTAAARDAHGCRGAAGCPSSSASSSARGFGLPPSPSLQLLPGPQCYEPARFCFVFVARFLRPRRRLVLGAASRCLARWLVGGSTRGQAGGRLQKLACPFLLLCGSHFCCCPQCAISAWHANLLSLSRRARPPAAAIM